MSDVPRSEAIDARVDILMTQCLDVLGAKLV
jgi:hypothetical protein